MKMNKLLEKIYRASEKLMDQEEYAGDHIDHIDVDTYVSTISIERAAQALYPFDEIYDTCDLNSILNDCTGVKCIKIGSICSEEFQSAAILYCISEAEYDRIKDQFNQNIGDIFEVTDEMSVEDIAKEFEDIGISFCAFKYENEIYVFDSTYVESF